MHLETKPSYNLLRWISMPLAAFLGAFVGDLLIILLIGFVIHQFGDFQKLTESDSFRDYFYLPVSYLVYPWLFIQITNKVAPNSKKTASVVMITLLATILLLLNIYQWVSGSNSLAEKIGSAILFLILITMSIFTHRQLHNREVL